MDSSYLAVQFTAEELPPGLTEAQQQPDLPGAGNFPSAVCNQLMVAAANGGVVRSFSTADSYVFTDVRGFGSVSEAADDLAVASDAAESCPASYVDSALQNSTWTTETAPDAGTVTGVDEVVTFRSSATVEGDPLENWQGYLRRGPYLYVLRFITPPGTIDEEGFVTTLNAASLKLLDLPN